MESASVAEELLLSWTVATDVLPTGDVEPIFDRLTLPPGASLPLLAGPFYDCPGETVKSGIGVEVVEEGAYALRLDAPFTVVRAGVVEEIIAGTEVSLGPDDVAYFPDYAAPGQIRTVGSDPVSVLGLAILSQEATGAPVPDLPAQVVARELSSTFSSEWSKLPPGPVTVTLRRLSLLTGADMAPVEPVGLETMHVVEGMVGITVIPAGETEPSQPLVYGPGSSTPMIGVRSETRRVVSNDGDEPAAILVLEIAVASEGAATPEPA